jgi:hypothetical protein
MDMRRTELAVLQFIAAAVILLGANIDRINRLLETAPPFARIVIPASAFVALYQVAVFVYRSTLWFVIHRQPNLSGYWAHGTQNTPEGQYFYGVFELEHRAGSIRLKGSEMWYEGKPPTMEFKRAVWTPELSVLEADRLAIVYTSVRIGSELRVSRQMLDLQVVGTRKNPELRGYTYGLGHPTGSYGFTTAVRLSRGYIQDAPARAFDLLGSRRADLRPSPHA